MVSTLALVSLDLGLLLPVECMDLPVTSFNAVHSSIVTTSTALAILVLLITLGALKLSTERTRHDRGEEASKDSFTSGHFFTFAL